MRLRATLIASVAVLAATFGSAAGASAATLYTNGAHTTPVAVGAAAGLTTTASTWYLTSATSVIDTCANSSLGLVVSQNSGGSVTATVTGGSFTGCTPLPWTGLYSPPWILTISGSPTTSGSVTSWNARLDNVRLLLGGGSASGSFTTGVTARQTGAGGGTCIVFNDAGQISGPLFTNGRWDATYCFEGAAASQSLT
jgi:hypothetical protein